MALHKEPNGLIYNDDGSLCVTLREDDVPFAGVKSFAVEEGTTNLGVVQGGVNLTRIRYAYQTTPPTYYQVTDEKWLGTTPLRVHTGEGGIRFFTTNSLVAGTTYTFSIYVRPQATRTMRLFTDENYGPQTVCPANQWTRLYLTSTPSSSLKWLTISGWQDNDVIDFAAPQLEFLPFATSFVDGTRPAGMLKIPRVRDFTSKVVTAWFKINYVRNYPRIFDMSDGSTDTTKGWAFYYDHVAGDFCFGVGSTVTKLTYSNPTNKWFYVVLIFNNGTYAVKLFDDSGLIWDYSFTATMPDLTNNIFKIGNVDSSGGYARPLNGPIAAPHIAEYKPSIWTAEYIQELYNMRRPFSVPPRMPII